MFSLLFFVFSREVALLSSSSLKRESRTLLLKVDHEINLLKPLSTPINASNSCFAWLFIPTKCFNLSSKIAQLQSDFLRPVRPTACGPQKSFSMRVVNGTGSTAYGLRPAISSERLFRDLIATGQNCMSSTHLYSIFIEPNQKMDYKLLIHHYHV